MLVAKLAELEIIKKRGAVHEIGEKPPMFDELPTF